MSRQSRSKNKKQLRSFWTAASLAVFVFLGAAVWQLNAFIHQNTLLKDCQKQITALSSENDVLAARLTQSNSLDNFNQYAIAQEGNYEKVDVASVRYIHASGAQLAKK